MIKKLLFTVFLIFSSFIAVQAQAPTISAFEIKVGEPSRIYFDSDEIITATDATGFVVAPANTITGVTIATDLLTGHYFTVTTPFVFTDTPTLEYTTGSNMEDASGNPLASFAATAITNSLTETTAPTISAFEIKVGEPSRIYFDSDEIITATDATGFVVAPANTITGVTIATDLLTGHYFTVTTPFVFTDTPTLEYTTGSNMEDASGNPLASFAATAITNSLTETTAPTISAFEIKVGEPSRIYFDSDEIITATDATGFVVAPANTITGVTIATDLLTGHYFTVTTPFVFTDTPTLEYTTGSNMEDASGNPLASFAATAITNSLTETTAPTISAFEIKVGEPSRIYFDSDEIITATDATGFVVAPANTITGVTIATDLLTGHYFTVTTPFVFTDTPTLEYTTGSNMEDASGNPLASFAATAITNSLTETTAPTISAFEIKVGEPSRIYFDSDEIITATDATGFVVAPANTITGVTIATDLLTGHYFTVTTPFVFTDTPTLEYTTGSNMEDASGNPLASFAATAITNSLTETTAPTISAFEIKVGEPSRIYFDSDEIITATDATGFVVAPANTITGVTIATDLLTGHYFTVTTPFVFTDTPTLEYTTGSNMEDASGNPLASFAATAITNSLTETTAPTISAFEIKVGEPSRIYFDSDEIITATDATGFVVAPANTITGVTIATDLLTGHYFTVTTPFVFTDTPTLEYTTGSNMEDASGNPLASFAATAITNSLTETTAPTISAFEIKVGEPSRIYFDSDEIITATDATGFVVAPANTITGVTIATDLLTGHYFTVTTPFVFTDTPTLEYTTGSNMEDASGNPLASFAATAITNSLTETTAPTISAFEIKVGEPSRIYFDSDEIITATDATGFVVAPANTITGVTIATDLLTGHYFTVTTPFVFTDTPTLEYTTGSNMEDASGNPLASFAATAITNSLAAPVASITMTTTSTAELWEIIDVVKTGDPLTWTATGVGIGTIITSVNPPIFDFSANDGSDINITVTSTDGFSGLTVLNFGDAHNSLLGNGTLPVILIKEIDLTVATELVDLYTNYNELTSLDISNNTKLVNLYVRGHNQLSAGLDISNNPLLESFWADHTALTTINLLNKTSLSDIWISNSDLTSEAMDQLVIDLDINGLTNGSLKIIGNTGNLTYVALDAYNSLIAKGWTIDVEPPPALNIQTIILTTTSESTTWSPEAVTNSGTPLKWVVSGAVTIDEVEENDPIFDLSGSAGIKTITITSDEGFARLTALDFNIGPLGLISSIDVSKATALSELNLSYNRLQSLDVTQNIALSSLYVRGAQQLSAGIDISKNPLLKTIWFDSTEITTLDVSNNSLLTDVRIFNSELTSAELNEVVNDLNNHGLSDGFLRIADNPGSLTASSYIAFNNLLVKGWDLEALSAPVVVSISPIVFLQGPMLNPDTAGLMNDDLRQAGFLPTTSPYSDALTVNASVFDAGGISGIGLAEDDIVDWVLVELRDAVTNTTIVSSRSALLQRDGDLVALDGVSPLPMDGAVDNYYVVIKHRNHLGIMSNNTFALSDVTSPIDFTDASNQITYGTNAQTIFGMPSSVVAMWAGDANSDGRLNYSGTFSENPSIRSQVFNDPDNSLFGGPPLSTYNSIGYNDTDVDLDGYTKYAGSTGTIYLNDVLHVRNNTFNNPSNSLFGGPPVSTFVFIQRLPEGAND